MTVYRVNQARLNDYLYYNINNPVVRSIIISDFSQDIYAFQNQQAAMRGPWEIFFDGYSPINSFDWGEENPEFSDYTTQQKRQILGFIIANRLRLPGEEGYQDRFGPPLEYNLTNDDVIEMADAGLRGGFHKFGKSKLFTLRTLKKDLKMLKNLKYF